MKIINATTGKIGSCVVGPKSFLNETIRLGEVTLCVGREDHNTSRPCIWILGGIEQLIDYVSLARSKNEIDDADATSLLDRLDQAKSQMPKTALERLSSILGIEINDLNELLEHAQVFVSAPVDGITDFSGTKPKWVAKANPNVTSIH